MQLAKITFENATGDETIVMIAQTEEGKEGVGIVALANEKLAARDESTYDLMEKDVFIALAQKFVELLNQNAQPKE